MNIISNALTPATPVRIKAEFGFCLNTLNCPEDGYLCNCAEDYDQATGKYVAAILEFDTVKEAVEFLTEKATDGNQGMAMACEYDGDGDFSSGGSYELSHGQHSRPIYTIVSRVSGRCTRAIVAAIEALTTKNDDQ